MKYKVVVSEEASKNIRNIFRYIALTLQSPENAFNQIKRIEKHIRGLSEMPYRFRVYKHGKWKGRGLHVMPVDNYCIFYIPDDESTTVTILQVMYGGQDIEKWLDKITL
ncbi:ParE toxin of type II toxin-antitoxin system, parDE [Anaerovibrio lipolyticus DSM 3074]|uniref:Type II toxin-antitoxin system RelE/ParE family toxin n=2 Tax=Anaerovibrio lipolyticus TaxID=82374 RepID=A0A0B2JYR2_9FIRM|nr:type II toxin-antitoxin system RelE/ParE family toxin [Anaerovibrio lipolyticus]KHM52699.1 hypothetical protein NZ47_03285 [Anaerovibrio lipolyticus]SHI71568.1 ParE toxin of type II toxin-antitoxin system, parDE [Anaerovibrio lipolyticus DSM 3074]